jgi:hypothetical protein
MSMWETPAGPAGGDDIALTTPTNADVPGLGAAVVTSARRAGVRQGRAASAAARDASRRNGQGSGHGWARSGIAGTAPGRAPDRTCEGLRPPVSARRRCSRARPGGACSASARRVVRGRRAARAHSARCMCSSDAPRHAAGRRSGRPTARHHPGGIDRVDAPRGAGVSVPSSACSTALVPPASVGRSAARAADATAERSSGRARASSARTSHHCAHPYQGRY